ncbi:hypothetical protein Rvan_0487 [Rhodomicrobium vannielii ATCC 17100]|uniref:Uncharacterized protein n=1 Tax=Rhodomicrobium vannielii (strain ATCC 17100 / DSM 162 / LMG 4299 / NCIMB 10020 / ATH 3.1.1) TaxID=648757 RepID=E3HYM8_RHOVT|nr:hypothetical protein [Rhodomicrobium vannielii]ADP69769.1 hypothetical protein Rvan_0487 [Rhodomicrobium vannielii ATCC 17100]
MRAEVKPVFRRMAKEAGGVIRLDAINPLHATYRISPPGDGKVLARLTIKQTNY